ncbi:MAG: HD domain-containing protein [Candidatus Saccharibacteria bacterium]|nr:HD domain-containing protein [Candidatus Saccharibacteria bacterium]
MRKKPVEFPAHLKLKNADIIEKYGGDILNDETFQSQKEYLQHGKVSVYDHVIYVADKSLSYAKRLHLKVDEEALVRGALLHDYYLYDWHIHGAFYRGHIIKHPKEAAEKAKQDFKINKKEESLIRRHMFPMTIVPPRYREGWLISWADKTSAVSETLGKKARRAKAKRAADAKAKKAAVRAERAARAKASRAKKSTK